MRSSSRRALSALAALALVAGSLLAAAPAQAATPISPDDASSFVGDSVTLTWNADATSNGLYLVRWWTLGGGIQSRQVPGTTTQLIDLADGTYYWNVAHYTVFVNQHRASLLNPTRTFTRRGAPLVNLSALPGTIGPEGSLVVLGIGQGHHLSLGEPLPRRRRPRPPQHDGDRPTPPLQPDAELRRCARSLRGTHTLKVVAQDAGSRTSEQSATFTVDGAGPDASFVSPTDGGWVQGGGADVPVSLSFSEFSSWSLYADGGYVDGRTGVECFGRVRGRLGLLDPRQHTRPDGRGHRPVRQQRDAADHLGHRRRGRAGGGVHLAGAAHLAQGRRLVPRQGNRQR